MKTIFFDETLTSKPTTVLTPQNFMPAKKQIKHLSLLIAMLMTASILFAQKDEKVIMGDVKHQCASLPREKRARLEVSRFTVTTSTTDKDARTKQSNNSLSTLRDIFGKSNSSQSAEDKIPPTLGDNLSTMLTDALQNVDCFRILDNSAVDSKKEIDKGNDGYTAKNSAAKTGHGLGAQILVVGEVTEYSTKSKGGGFGPVSSSKNTVKIGFVVKMKNPETNEIIVSHQFRVQSQSGKNLSIMGWHGGESDPATAAVMEDGVVQAVQYLARMRDSLNITADGNFAGNGTSDGNKVSEISLINANYTSYNAFAGILSGIPAFKSMDKSLSGGVGNFTVTHSGSTDDFVALLSKKIGNAYEITGAEAGKIDLKVK